VTKILQAHRGKLRVSRQQQRPGAKKFRCVTRDVRFGSKADIRADVMSALPPNATSIGYFGMSVLDQKWTSKATIYLTSTSARADYVRH
jgi:hypothetical protein